MQTLGARRARDVAAVAFVAAALIAAILFFRWAYSDTAKPQLVEGTITGFSNSLVRGQMRAQIVASIRLPDGSIWQMRWPDDQLVCRVGDKIRVERHDHYLRLVKADCA